MRISDWSSDVCSSDLGATTERRTMGTLAGDRSYGLCRADGSGRPALPSNLAGRRRRLVGYRLAEFLETKQVEGAATVVVEYPQEIGRASCRERVWQYG